MTTLHDPSRRELTDLIWRRSPEFATSFFPKRWQMPHGVYSPEEFLPALFAQFEIFANEEYRAAGQHEDVCNMAWIGLGVSLREFGTRVYRVEPELVTTMRRTSLKGFTFDGLDLPLPSFLIMLPHGAMHTESDGDVLGIGVAVRDGMFILTAPLESGSTFTFTSPLDDKELEALLNKEEEGIRYQQFSSVTEELFVELSGGDYLKFGKEPDRDRMDLRQIVYLTLNLLAYISMRSDEEKVIEPVKRKRKKGKFNPQRDRPFYAPFVIGERYARGIRSGSSTSPKFSGTGRTVSLHWRAGHWRHQRYGKGREKVKLIHIEPVLVGVK